MVDVYLEEQDIVVNVMKDLQVTIVMVRICLFYFLPISLILSLVRIMSSGCLSNPCTIGICYQLNQNSASYVCICPDGTLSLSCNATSNRQMKNLFLENINSFNL